MKLYKYCSGDYTIENLKNGQIFLGQIQKCNDPHEGAFNFSIENNLLSEFLSIHHLVKANILMFRPPHEVLQTIQFDEMKRFGERTGVACFSEVVNSMTMWGHYANKQLGICLEFEKNGLEKYGIDKVIYKEEVPRITVLNRDHLSIDSYKKNYREVGLTKSLEWEYEKEWRILGDSGVVIPYDLDCLTGVYFGFRTEKEYVKRVFQATANYRNIKYYKPGLKLDNYGVKFFEVVESDLM